MDENNNDGIVVDELTLDDEQPPVIEEAAAFEEVVHESIYVPVESLGSGVVSALADMVGGLVGLKGSAETSIKKGVQIIKDQVSQANIPNSAPNDGTVAEPEQVADVEPEQVIAVEPTSEQIMAVEPTSEQIMAVEPTSEQVIAVEPTSEQVAQDKTGNNL